MNAGERKQAGLNVRNLSSLLLIKTKHNLMRYNFENEIRQREGLPPKVKDKKTKRETNFNPLFLAVVKRIGRYYLKIETLTEYKTACTKAGLDWNDFLKQNKLSIDYLDSTNAKIFSLDNHFVGNEIFNKK